MDWHDAAMNKLSTNLQRFSLSLIVSYLAIGLFVGHPVSMWAAEKAKPAPAQNAQAPGRLVIVRGASLGPTVVALKIDGQKAADISYNRRYDAPLAAGPHTLTVSPVTSLEGAKPTERQINVEPGKTYTFTAARQDIQLVLK